MADESRSSLSDAARVAHTVAGAVKAGKSIASAAKGAAVGGPYGAVAGVLWEHRKTVGKIVAAFSTLLVLPILFIVMLPSLIFGDMSETQTPDNAVPLILNDDAAIMGNIDAISTTVGGVLNEGVYDVAARIEADFTASGKDNYEVINPYENSPAHKVNLFISQYCAAKDTDYTSISVADLESVLRSAKGELYTFTFTDEQREVAAVEVTPADPPPSTPPTPAEPTYEEWRIYTVVYNGENYFADAVFKLTDEQKLLARDYAHNLALFLDDGSIQYYSGSWSSVSYDGVVFGEGETAVVYYNQFDARYADKPYGLDDIAHYGCGPTSMAMVVSTLTSETVDPVQMAKWSYDNDFWYSGGGSWHDLIPGAAKAWGLPVEGCTASEPQRIVDALMSGKLVVVIMAKGHFTKEGHFIVLRGVTSTGSILVADPGSYERSGQEWDLSIILNEAKKKDVGAGGPFWLIG